MSTLGLGPTAPELTTTPEPIATPELTLADVLSRGILVEWFEAVAVVRATMEELGAGTEQRSTPDLGQVWLARAGAIRLSGGSYDDQPVRRLGQLLQALLTQGDPPVTLKIVVGNAMAAVPIYAGLRELDDALAYFERPDRAAILRGLYARAEGQADGGGHALRSVDDVAPLPRRSSRPAPRFTRSAQRIVTALLIVVMTIGAAFLLVRAYRQGERFPVGPITVAARHATVTLGDAMLSGISAVTERVGLGRLTPREATAVVTVPATEPKTASSGHAGGRPLLKASAVIQAFDLGKDIAAPAPASPLLMAAVPDARAGETRPTEVAPAVVTDTTVYSADSPDVAPPIAIRPQFPRTLPEGVAQSDLSRIELIIQRDGTVESVKLVPGSRRSTVKDGMLLSAAKAWRFAPATKSGMPVRYRKTIWIIAE